MKQWSLVLNGLVLSLIDPDTDQFTSVTLTGTSDPMFLILNKLQGDDVLNYNVAG